MKKRDIIQLVKETIAERRKRYGQHDYYGNNVGGRNSISGMPGVWEESQGTLSSDMLNYADQYHMELVDTMKGVSTHPDKRTDGFYIKFPHAEGPPNPALFGKDVRMKIEASKAAAKAAAQKTVSKFQDQIEDYEITDSSPGGVYGSIHLWIMPKSMDEMHDFEKKYGDKIKVDDFKNNPKLQQGKIVMYGGTRYKVLENTGYVLTLQSLETEKIKKVNLGQFISQGAIKEKTMKNKKIKEDISDDISKAEDEVQTAKAAVADAESKVADAQKKKADAEKSALEETTEESMNNADIGILNDLVQKYSPEKLKITIDILSRGTTLSPTDMDWNTKDSPAASAYNVDMGPGNPSTMENMMESYIKERGDDNLMEYMDQYRRRATLMEGATQKLFALFNQGKTDADVRAHYLQMNVDMPEAFIAKLRKNWEALRKTKLDLTLADKEAEGFNTIQAPGENGMEGEVGMEPPMEEKQLASGLK